MNESSFQKKLLLVSLKLYSTMKIYLKNITYDKILHIDSTNSTSKSIMSITILHQILKLANRGNFN